jgi:pyruvate kinase
VSTILMGADGLVLAAESAIGKHPVQSVQMLNSLIKQYRKWSTESSILEVLNS